MRTCACVGYMLNRLNTPGSMAIHALWAAHTFLLSSAVIVVGGAVECALMPSCGTLTLKSCILQVGSHYHFVETNPLLFFDRQLAYGYRLNILPGTAVRFEVSRWVSVGVLQSLRHALYLHT